MSYRLTGQDRINRDKIDEGFNKVLRVLIWCNLLIIPLVLFS